MRIKISPLLMAGGLVVASLLPVADSTAGGGSQQQARLEQRAARIDSELGQKTGGMQRAELRQQRQQIDEAIQKLQAGRGVTAEDVDRILGETSVERAD